MKWFKGFFVLWWIGLCIALFFGYEPNKIQIGCAFLLSALLFALFFFNKIH